MRLFNNKNLLLLIGAQLLISIILVEAGLFDFNKNKDKNKKDDSNKGRNKQDTVVQDEGKRNVAAYPRRGNTEKVAVDEAALLAADLSKMDQPKVAGRPRRPQKFSNMLAAAKEQSRLEEERNQAQQEEVAESEENKPAAPAKVGKVNIHNILNKNKNVDDTKNSQTESDQQDSAPAAAASGLRVRHPKPASGGVRTPSSSLIPASNRAPKHSYFSNAVNTISDNKLMHAHFWKKELKDAYQVTKEKVKELPTVVKDATDSMSAMLKLDSRGRLLAMIKEVEDDISFVRAEFSNFSINWSPLMEKALSYIGSKDLNKMKYNDKDELDFRKDALIVSVFGYEFMRLMMAWRENLMIGHQAYKEYLQQVLNDLEKEKFEVKEDFMYQLETIHNYILLNCWQEIDNLAIESKMKLDYLMDLNDQRPKNYESEYFRHIVLLQEIYEPSTQEFKEEREQVINALSESGQTDDSFNDVDEFFDEFKNKLVKNENGAEVATTNNFDWEVPNELEQFMNNLQDELRYNQAIYQKSFLKDLKEAKERAMSEMYGTEATSE